MSEYAGSEAVQKQVPAFTVKKLTGQVEHTIRVCDPKTGNWANKIIKEPAGYMVSFPKGHSLRVKTTADLVRLKLNRVVPLVDMAKQEVVGSIDLGLTDLDKE